MIRSKKITNSARGEHCTVQILGICRDNTETVVFAHFPDGSHGMACKATDLSGGFCCSACHDAIDRRVRCNELEDRRDWYLRRAQTRTLERLLEKGVLKVA